MPEASVAAADNVTAQAATTVAPAETPKEPIKVAGKEYGSWDEVGKAYESLNSEFGKRSQELGELRKQYEQVYKLAEQGQKWSEWWKDIQPLWGEDVEDFLRKKMAAGGKQGVQAAQQLLEMQKGQSGQWDGWELLPAQEQAARMQQFIMDGLQGQFNQRLAEMAKAIQDTFTQKENWYQTYLNNHLGLLRKALEQKLQNPQFDIDKTMEMAAQALSGQVDPLQLGQQLINAQTFQAQIEAAKKAAYEQGKKDFEQEFKNKQTEPPPMSIGGAPKFKIPNLNNGNVRQGLATLREKAAENLAKTFGPDLFLGERR